MYAEMHRLRHVALGIAAALVLVGADAATVTYQHDSKGRVLKATHSDGTVVDYSYDANGSRIAAIVTPLPPDTTPPSAPGTPTISNITGTSATATWTAATDNVGVAGYQYQVNTAAWQSIGNVLTVNLTNLVSATGYTFNVQARDAASNLGSASSRSFTTLDTVAPTVPTGLSGSAPNSSTVNLSWNASTDNVQVTGYRVYRGGSHIGNSATTSYSDGGRTCGTTYSYQVQSHDAVPNYSSLSSAINVATPDTTAPSTPTSLSATAVSPSQINLVWGASTDTCGSGLAGYRVYRNGSHIASPSTSSFSDTGLATSTSYSYTVTAYDNATNTSGHSNTAGATTLCPVVASLSATTWTWRLRDGAPMTVDPPRVCTGSGGSGTGYTYAWQRVSGDTQTSASNPTSNITDWSRSVPDQTATYTSIWRCLVTDGFGNTGQNTVTVNFIRRVP